MKKVDAKEKNSAKNNDTQNNLSNFSDAQNLDGAKIVADIKISQIDSIDELETYKKLIKRRRKRLISRIFTFVLLLLIAPVMIFLTSVVIDKNGKHDFFGYAFYVVATPSMEPDILVNDCVVLKHISSKEELAIGDDIGYVSSSGAVIVHRIMSIETNSAGETVYKTKGINNANYDQLAVSFDSIVGKKVSTLRVFGNTVIFFRSTGGIIMLVSLFVMIVVGFYLAFKFTENISYIEPVTKKE